MSESLLELIEMDNGDVALKRVDTDSEHAEPIVTLKFSKDSLDTMQESKMLIAQAMIEAGMMAYSELTDIPVTPLANEDVVLH